MSSRSDSHSIYVSTIKSKLIRSALKSTLLVVVFTFSLVAPTQAWAITRWVDALAASLPPGTGCGPLAAYKTIQDAVNAALPGDIIMVCPGIYPEPAPGPLTINKSLTLQGAQFGMDARGRVAAE